MGAGDVSSISADHATTIEPLLAESIDILKEKYNICIITARPYPNAYKITKSWLDKHNFYLVCCCSQF